MKIFIKSKRVIQSISKRHENSNTIAKEVVIVPTPYNYDWQSLVEGSLQEHEAINSLFFVILRRTPLGDNRLLWHDDMTIFPLLVSVKPPASKLRT